MSAGTSSGGAYYATAVILRQQATDARKKQAVAERNDLSFTVVALADGEAVLCEVAAALYCVAQAIEDSRPAPILRKTEEWTVVPKPGETP